MARSITLQCYDPKYLENFDNTGNDEIHFFSLNNVPVPEDKSVIPPRSETSLIRIQDFKPFFMLRLPDYINQRAVEWTPERAVKVFDQIKQHCGKTAPVSFRFFMKETLHYYKGKKKSGFLELRFKTKKSMYASFSLLKNPLSMGFGNVYCTPMEIQIDQVTKMLHAINPTKMRHCSWYKFVPDKILEKDEFSSVCDHEYIVSYTKIFPLSEEESSKLFPNPRILSFDIEQDSSNPNAMPNANKTKDHVYAITATIGNLRDNDYEKLCLVTVQCRKEQLVAKVMQCMSETDLINKFTDVIIEHRPHVFTGFNIMGFDFKALNIRLTRRLNEWKNCSWYIDYQPEVIKKKLESSGTGYNDYYYLWYPGVLVLDMYPVIKRLFKLRIYKMGYVAAKFLGDDEGKLDVTAKQMFAYLAELRESRKLLDMRPQDPVVKERYERALDNETKVIEYAIRDADIPIKLFKLFSTWTSHIEASNICGVDVMTIVVSGQQERTLSQLYTEALISDFIIDRREKTKDIPLKGGYVYSEPGISDHLPILDYSSLYPSIARWLNLCYTTFLPQDLWHTVPEDKCNIFKFTQEELDELEEGNEGETRAAKIKNDKNAKKKTVEYEIRFVKKEVREGLLPRMITKLLKERKRLKKLMNAEQDPVQKSILNERQLNVKITNNSIYGFTAAQKKGKLPFVEIAAVITLMGRTEILKCNKFVEEKYGGKVRFNDTDSFGFEVPGKTGKEMVEMATTIEKDINALYATDDGSSPVMNIEVEKICRQCRFAPKKYVWVPIDRETYTYIVRGPDDLVKKGIASQRRDIAPFVSTFYDELLCIIMRREPIQNGVKLVIRKLHQLLSGNVNPKDLAISCSLGASYESETAFMLVFSERMAEAGYPIEPGSRVEYLIIDTGDRTQNTGMRMELLDRYMQTDPKDRPKIDYYTYLKNKIGNTFQQAFEIGFGEAMNEYEDKGYLPISKRKKFRSSKKVFDMIVAAMDDGNEYTEVLNFVGQIFDVDAEEIMMSAQYDAGDNDDASPDDPDNMDNETGEHDGEMV